MIEKNRHILDKPEKDNDSDHWKMGIFYYNREDSRMFVRRRYAWGWTINFANPYAVMFIIITSSAAAVFAILQGK